MRKIEGQWRQVALLAASAAAASCSGLGGDAQSQRRQVTVLNVQPRSELGPGVDVRCVDPTAVGPNDDVAVVRYRVGRAPHVQAFAIPVGRRLNKGDTLVVHPSECTMNDRLRQP